MNKTKFICAVIVALNLICGIAFAEKAKIIEYGNYSIYLPAGINTFKKYPVVIALSPGGNYKGMINTWRGVAEEFKWIVLASKKFRNNVDAKPILNDIAASIRTLAKKHPIDKTRIIASGMSGGGMGAHMMSFLHSEVVQAVVSNVGIIHKYYMNEKSSYPKGKLAVLLASPTDPNYKEMRGDKLFLESLGWRVKWIEFKGGHRIAPPEAFKKGARWLNANLNVNYY